MQCVFVIITKLIASKKYFCKEFFCKNFGRPLKDSWAPRAVRSRKRLHKNFLVRWSKLQSSSALCRACPAAIRQLQGIVVATLDPKGGVGKGGL